MTINMLFKIIYAVFCAIISGLHILLAIDFERDADHKDALGCIGFAFLLVISAIAAFV